MKFNVNLTFRGEYFARRKFDVTGAKYRKLPILNIFFFFFYFEKLNLIKKVPDRENRFNRGGSSHKHNNTVECLPLKGRGINNLHSIVLI